MGLKMLIRIFVLLFLMSCSLSKHPSFHHGHEANKHMLRHSHQHLIAEFDDPKRDEWQKPERIIQLLGDIKDKKIVDLGSGSGYFTYKFLKHGGLVTAADVDAKFLEHIQKRFQTKDYPNLKTHLMKMDDPELGENLYEIIYSCNTYHHIDQRVDYFKKVLRALKKDGQLMIVDFSPVEGSQKSFGPPAHLRLSQDLVMKELNEAGFKKLKLRKDVLEHQYIITGSKTF
jgi:cyclopropane fatty-acyl-phospholipid synthase-like methyltransferase